MILVSNPQASYESQGAEIDRAIHRVLHSGHYIGGDEVERFEKRFANYTNNRYCVSCGSGTDAMKLAVYALFYDKIMDSDAGIGVATVSLTSPGTLPMPYYMNFVMRGVDVDKSMTMNIESLKNIKNIDLIIPVHLYGNPVDMLAIREYAKEQKAYVIEDCCQAHGTRVGGKHVGYYGDLGVFSFYPTKNLGAIGDGGAVVTNSEELWMRMLRFRQYGWYPHVHYNSTAQTGQSRLDPIQAAILNEKLDRLDYKIEQRKIIAGIYLDNINCKRFEHLDWKDGCSFHQFVILLESREYRELFMKYLFENGIDTGIHYPIPLHKQNAYKEDFFSSEDNFTNTENYCDRIVSLPMYPEITGDEIMHVINVVNKWSETL